MKNKDYIDFYDESLKGNIIFKKYLPVKNELIKIINFYDDKGVCEYSWYKDGIDLIKLDFIKRLLRLFNKIITNNKYDNLDDYVDFLIALDPWYEDYLFYLELFIFKENFNNYNEDYYYSCFDQLCHNITSVIVNINNDFLVDLNTNSRILNILKSFAKYYKNHYVNCESKEKDKRVFYYCLAPLVLADFYKTDLEIENLDKILDEIVYNSENIQMFNEDHSHTQKEMLALVENLISKYNNPKKLIK